MEADEIEGRLSGVGGEEQRFREMEREATIIGTTITPRKRFIAVQSELFRKYIFV